MLAEHEATITSLYERSDTSAAQFEAVYQPLIVRLAEWVQRLPSQNRTQPTLLAERLNSAQRALSRRRGVFLPPHAEPERIAHEADVWTYAVFSIALLRALGPTLAHWQVTLYSPQQHWRWLPWQVSLSASGAVYYHVKRRIPAYAHDTTPLLANRLVPPLAQNWLWDNPTVWAVWAKALSEPQVPAVLTALLDDRPARSY
ncbi:MAG: TraI domain-containing protein [Caldilineaceae bacterium]|nr:TraI domain-containing protein [Caldilineaceae bacterium]